jgi:hypothetical protein
LSPRFMFFRPLAPYSRLSITCHGIMDQYLSSQIL